MYGVREYLETIPYLAGLTEGDLALITEHSRLYRFVMGDIIFLEGDPSRGLWVIESGVVKIYKTGADGSEYIMHLSGDGATFNDIAALDGGLTPATAAVLSPELTAWLIPCETLRAVITQNAQVALNVIQVLTRRVRILVGQMEDLALHSVSVRLARFLLRQAHADTTHPAGVTRTAIAAHLNTTPQTISVILRELEAAGALEFNRQRIQIVDKAVLRRIALLER